MEGYGIHIIFVYLGKTVLKDILKTELYNHFLTFSVAIAILVSLTLSASHAVYAEQLVVYFVHICQQLYNDEFWCRITQVFLAKKLLNGCSSSSSLFACAAYSCVHSNNVHSV